jgi:hypothetical protein
MMSRLKTRPEEIAAAMLHLASGDGMNSERG